MRRMTRTDSAAILCTLIRFAKAHRMAEEVDKALAALSVCSRHTLEAGVSNDWCDDCRVRAHFS